MVGVGGCSCSQWCWVTANQGGFLLPRTGPGAGPFPVLACSQDVPRALGRRGWDEVTSSAPCQNGSDEHLPPQHMSTQLPERLVAPAVPGLLSSSEEEVPLDQTYFLHQILIKVICWSTPAANLSLGLLSSSCLNHTLMNDQCEVDYEEEMNSISVQCSVFCVL